MSRFYKTCDKKQLAEKTSNSSERCTRFCASAVGWGAPTCGSRVYLLLFSLLALVPCNGPKLNDRGETAIHSHPHSHSHLGSVQSEHMAKFHIHDVTWKHTVAKCHLQVDFWTMGLPQRGPQAPCWRIQQLFFHSLIMVRTSRICKMSYFVGGRGLGFKQSPGGEPFNPHCNRVISETLLVLLKTGTLALSEREYRS